MRGLAIAIALAIVAAGACSRPDKQPAAPLTSVGDPRCARSEVATAGNALAVYIERSRTLVLQVQAYPNDPRNYIQNLETDLKELDLLVKQVEKQPVPACAAKAKELAIGAIRGIHGALDLRRPDVDQEKYRSAFAAAQQSLEGYNTEIRRVALAAAP
jgi:hypothetical protein